MTIEKVGDLIHQNCIFTILVIGGSISLSEDALATFGRERFSPVTSLLQIWDWKHLRVHMGHLGAFCSQPGGRGQMGPSHGPSLHFMGGNGGGVRPTNPLRRAEIRVEMPRPRGIWPRPSTCSTHSRWPWIPRISPNGWMRAETRIKKNRLRLEEDFLRSTQCCCLFFWLLLLYVSTDKWKIWPIKVHFTKHE